MFEPTKIRDLEVWLKWSKEASSGDDSPIGDSDEDEVNATEN